MKPENERRLMLGINNLQVGRAQFRDILKAGEDDPIKTAVEVAIGNISQAITALEEGQGALFNNTATRCNTLAY